MLLLLLLLLLRACKRACAAACMIDTMYQLMYMSAQTQAWRIEFSHKDIRDQYHDQYWRLKGLLILTVSIDLEYYSTYSSKYLYTKIRFFTPVLSALLPLTAQIFCLNK